jgi:hypothetical protein
MCGPRVTVAAMEIPVDHEDELFAVRRDDNGHTIQRAVRDMTPGEVITTIDLHTAEAANSENTPNMPNRSRRG